MRAGLIIGGRCIMAPSSLDLDTPGGRDFVSRARNGIIVLLNGEQPPSVKAYNEDAGTLDVVEEHEGISTKYGRVRVYPGTLDPGAHVLS